jgi:hypothetical protein
MLGIYLFALNRLQGFADLVALVDKTLSILLVPGLTNAPNDVLVWVTFFPLAVAFWPVFRFIGPGAAHGELLRRQAHDVPNFRGPWWVVAARSPWWGTLAMWPCTIAWSTSVGWTSFAPLTIPLAVAMAWKHGARAMVPIFVGALPFLFREHRVTEFTIGGVWPLIVVLFWAKFTADASFRQQLLRREHLSWAEALLVVLLLSPMVQAPSEAATYKTYLDLNSSWMLASIAFVIGSSRMPAHKFAIAVVLGWLVGVGLATADKTLTFDFATVSFGIKTPDALAALLALYAASAWRTYAAAVQAHVENPDRGFAGKLLAARQSGNRLMVLAVLAFGVFLGGVAPGLRMPGADPLVVPPGPAVALIAAFSVGLIARNLWADRGIPLWPRVRSRSSELLEIVRSPIVLLLLVVPAAIFAKGWYDVGGIRVGMFQERAIYGTEGPIGLAVCGLVFVAFGMAVRRAQEKRKLIDESWAAWLLRLIAAKP